VVGQRWLTLSREMRRAAPDRFQQHSFAAA
jgi:hypothetical protein